MHMKKVEREILSKMPDEPNLRYCDMNKYPGFCNKRDGNRQRPYSSYD